MSHQKFTYRTSIRVLGWIAIYGLLSYPVVAEVKQRPNVVVVLADDMGWGDLSLHGNPNLETPNLDALAQQGAQLNNFYVCAVCSPTRAEFLTGRYHTRMGVVSTSEGGERFDLTERTIGDAFREAGYVTAAYGKWHSGMQPPYHPNARGFDDFYGFCSGHWGNYFSPLLEHNGRIVQGNGFIVDDLTNHAIEFIERHSTGAHLNQEEPIKKPFFVYLPLNTPHSPMQVPDDDWAPFAGIPIAADPEPVNAKREQVLHTRAALALCKNIDDNVGRLLGKLDELKIASNTIVVFFSDNGPNGSRFNGGMRGRKGAVYEGGLRSPAFIRWPSSIRSGVEVESISGAIDLLPTLVELADVPVGNTAGPIDGVSLADLLRTSTRNEHHTGNEHAGRLIFAAWNGKTSVRSQRFRYHRNGHLYEIERDRGEQNNVAAKFPDVAERLKKQLDQWGMQTSQDGSTKNRDRRFPVGHPEYEWTQLPARDAIPTGRIRRSNRHPNSTYMTQWTSPDDAIVWNVNVQQAGFYDVQIYYACSDSAIGTEIQLTWTDGDQNEPDWPSIRKTVDVANDSDFLATQYDRFPRVEGLEKHWVPLNLGTIELTKANGQLRLTAPSIAGESAQAKAGVEMRLMMLHRLSQ